MYYLFGEGLSAFLAEGVDALQQSISIVQSE